MEPHSLAGGTGKGGWVGMGLACGLQDQRLMARPPARAGGRSGLLTGGESGKPNGSSLPSPKGYRPTFPARPSWWAGHEALVFEAAGQVGRSKNHAASTTVQRKGVWGKETLSPAGSRGTAPGALSPISPEKWGPAREGQVPAVPTAPRKNHNAPQGASLSLR